MSDTSVDGIAQHLDAWAEDIAQLAMLHAIEPNEALLTTLTEVNFPTNLGVPPTSSEGKTARALMDAALRALSLPLPAETRDTLAVDFADIYLNHTIGASPYESVWIDEDNLALQEPTFQVRALYRAFHVRAPNWRVRSEDHISLELDFVAHLLRGSAESAERFEALETFLDRHLLRWLPRFAARVVQHAGTDYFRGVAAVTAASLAELRATLEQISGRSRPTSEEIDRLMSRSTLIQIRTQQYVPGAGASW